jgi:hypothetical protein
VIRTPSHLDPTLGRPALDRIGRGLRKLYAPTLVDPLPDNISAAVERLAQHDGYLASLKEAAEIMRKADKPRETWWTPAAGRIVPRFRHRLAR